jgi:DNA-binding response OmpR family regulator
VDQLHAENFEVAVITHGAGALAAIRTTPPHLVVLDTTLQELSGGHVLREIRRDNLLSRLPVLMLTESSREEERVSSFELGADDLITKPFSPRELLARIRALLWRAEKTVRFRNVLQFGKLVIDRDFSEVSFFGQVVPTSVLEFRLLCHLASRPGLVFTREELRQAVWGSEKSLNSRSIDVSVRRLREKIERKPNDPEFLRTVRGAGYVFEPELDSKM